jgi:ParB family chromosome partitioning protein
MPHALPKVKTAEERATNPFKTVFKEIELTKLIPHPNNRKDDYTDDAFKELVASIKEVGVLTPILVREDLSGYQIIGGHRRYYAAVQCGIKKLMCSISSASEQEGLMYKSVDNSNRKEMSGMEWYSDFLSYKKFGGTRKELAAKMGKSEEWLKKLIQIGKLPEDIRKQARKERWSLNKLTTYKPPHNPTKLVGDGEDPPQVEQKDKDIRNAVPKAKDSKQRLQKSPEKEVAEVAVILAIGDRQFELTGKWESLALSNTEKWLKSLMAGKPLGFTGYTEL